MKRLAIYAHYDPQHEIKPYVRHAVEALRSQCEEVHFISTANLPESALATFAGTCSSVALKENNGLDFGMWQKVLGTLDLGAWDEIILLNSSVYGPVTPLASVLSEAEGKPWDFWGITDSFEMDYHIQSYFLAFRSDLLRSEAFRRFWEGVLPYRSKRQIIRSYEIGLTQYLLESGYRPGVIFPYQRLVEECSARVRWHRGKRLHPTNTVVAYAEPLLERGSPFVKVELLRDNPLGMDLAPVWSAMSRLGYPADCLLPVIPRRSRTRSRKGCVICGSPGLDLYLDRTDARFGSTEAWDVLRCSDPDCRLVWLEPGPDAPGSEAHADDDTLLPIPRSRIYQGFQETLHSLYRGILRWMDLEPRREASFRHGLNPSSDSSRFRMLDLDCRDARRLRQFREMGWKAEGHLAEPDGAESLRKEGFTIHSGDLEALTPASYHAVLLGDRLGQVEDPTCLLRACHALLAEGGIICIEEPNAAGLGHRCFRRHWQGMDVPRRRYAFTPGTLKVLLERSGFDAVQVATTPVLAEAMAQDSLDLLRRGHCQPCRARSRVEGGLTASAYQIVALLLHRVLPDTGDTCLATARRP